MGRVFHYVVTFDEDLGTWQVYSPDGVDFLPVNFENGEVFNRETGEWEHIMGPSISEDAALINKYDIGQSNLEDFLDDYNEELMTQMENSDEEEYEDDDDE